MLVFVPYGSLLSAVRLGSDLRLHAKVGDDALGVMRKVYSQLCVQAAGLFHPAWLTSPSRIQSKQPVVSRVLVTLYGRGRMKSIRLETRGPMTRPETSR